MHSAIISETITYVIVCLGTINIIRMTAFLIGSDIYRIREHYRRRKGAVNIFPLPTFTVIVPAHNEENTIVSCLKSIVNCSYSKEKLQIIVVDDGSTDSTVSIVEEFIRKNSSDEICLLRQENQGKAHALNNGLRGMATGELVMCLDADSSIGHDALFKAAKYFIADKRVVALAANVRIRPTRSILNLAQRIEYIISYQFKRSLTFFNIEYIVGGIGSVFRHSALRKVNYYDTDTITEDIDLTMKFLKLGNKEHRVVYGPDVMAYTEGVLDIAGLIRQRFRWKYGRTQTLLKGKGMFMNLSRKQGKLLTCVYLPFIVFSDLAFFLEPILLGYLIYVSVHYHDMGTFIIAFSVMNMFMILNILSEDSMTFRERFEMGLLSPFMYFLFHIITFVEYVALMRSAFNIRKIWMSVNGKTKQNCSWTHVARTARESVPR